jgi:1-acyl-sn-glycerol-3-phosphate acyltransferase
MMNPRQWPRLAYEYFWLYVGYAYFGVLGVLWTMVSSVLALLLPRRLGTWLGRHAISVLFRGFLMLMRGSGLVRVDLSALDQLRGERGLVIAPNHPCLLDAVFVLSRIPQANCIMKAEIWDSPVLGGGARLAGYIRNDSPRNMVRLAADELAAGKPLLVFPEGTRTRTPPLNRFKGGFALIAKRAQAPIQTVFIETDSAFLGKGWPALKKPQLPIRYRVRLGQRFTVDGDIGTFLSQLEHYYRAELAQWQGARACVGADTSVSVDAIAE